MMTPIAAGISERDPEGGVNTEQRGEAGGDDDQQPGRRTRMRPLRGGVGEGQATER